MRRSDVINSIGRAVRAETYLEIGVESGTTFREVEIATKHGVDPDLKVNPADLDGTFDSLTSDAFFSDPNQIGRKFDVIFIDGLHTFEQSLRDLCMALSHVSDNGAILIDDVLPSDAIAALRDHGRARRLKELTGAADRNWMGDVFKTVAFLHDYFPFLEYATTSSEPTICVVWKAKQRIPPTAPLFPAMIDIAMLEYVSLIEDDRILRRLDLGEIVAKISGEHR